MNVGGLGSRGGLPEVVLGRGNSRLTEIVPYVSWQDCYQGALPRAISSMRGMADGG